MIKKYTACFFDKTPDASGLFLVLFTLRSNGASIKSLIVHPAPLITIEPKRNKIKFLMTIHIPLKIILKMHIIFITDCQLINQ